MNNVAILVGNSEYEALDNLECCTEDVKAIGNLLHATGKYSTVRELVNQDSDSLKDSLRVFVQNLEEGVSEIFYYL